MPGVIDTLRLCPDYVEIRRRMNGEIFQPLAN